jgi:hypothetical protein
MGTISYTCGEGVPLYLSILGWENVNLDSLAVSFLSRQIAWNMPGCYNTGFLDVMFVLGESNFVFDKLAEKRYSI